MPANHAMIVTMLVVALTTPVHGQDASSAARVRIDAQMTCGTRVAEYVLAWCGHPTDSADLLWELQEGRPDKLVSVAALTAALEERGLRTRTVRADPPGVVEWSGPVIYHTQGTNGVGHFFVQTPARGEFPRLFWCNVEGFSRELPPQYAEGLSGVMVLVSESAISDPSSLLAGPEARATAWRTPLRWIAAGSIAAVAVGVVVFRLRRARPDRGNLQPGG